MYGMEYDYGVANATLATSFAALGGMLIFVLAVAIFMIVCLWKIFTKANQEGWKAIVPVYNMYILVTQISGLSIGMFILCFVPIVQFYPLIKSIIELNKKFGKGIEGAILMLIFPYIMYPVLAFGSATYNSNESGNDTLSNNVNTVNNTNNTLSTPAAMVNESGLNNGVNNGVNNGMNVGVSASAVAPGLPSDNLNAPNMNANNGSSFNVTPNNFSGNVTPNNFNGNVGSPLPVDNNNINQTTLENQLPSVTPVETPVVDNTTPVFNTANVEAPVNTEATKFCPQCGTKVNASDAMCFMCGHKF